MALPKIHAVLTADIVNSTRLEPDSEKHLLSELNKASTGILIEFYRGDSFQVYLKNPIIALKMALLYRTIAIGLNLQEEAEPFDIRVSIGIGTTIEPVKKLGVAKGEAFLLSGRMFDAMQKNGPRLAIISANELANAGFSILTFYLNSIFEGMTAKQAEIISGLLTGLTQREIAGNLNKSNSTVHQMTVSGRWPEIEVLLNKFEDLVKLLS